jgi:hypothetical protein
MEINYLSILVATVAAFMVGWLWYGPLFGKPWMALMGISPDHMNSPEMRGQMWKVLVGGFVVTLVLVYVLANLMIVVGATDAGIGTALVFGFWMWLGFIATIMFNSVLYERRPLKLYIINASHYLVAVLVATLVLAWWPW